MHKIISTLSTPMIKKILILVFCAMTPLMAMDTARPDQVNWPQWLKESGILDRFPRATNLESFGTKQWLDLGSYTQFRLKEVSSWLQEKGLWETIRDLSQLEGYLESLELCQLEQLTPVLEWLAQKGIGRDKFSGLLNAFIERGATLKDGQMQKYCHCRPERIKDAEFLIKGLDLNEDGLEPWEKFRLYAVICANLIGSPDYSWERLQKPIEWMKQSGAWEMCDQQRIRVQFLSAVGRQSLDRLKAFEELMKSNELWLNGGILLSFFENFPHGKDSATIAKALQTLKRCRDLRRLEGFRLGGVLQFLSSDNFEKIEEFMRDIDLLNRIEEDSLYNVLQVLGKFDLSLLRNLQAPLPTDNSENALLYAVCVGTQYDVNGRVKKALEEVIFNIPSSEMIVWNWYFSRRKRERVVEDIGDCLGETNPLVQELLELMYRSNDEINPDGIIGIHREALEKSDEMVVHTPVSHHHPGVTLNCELIRQPRPMSAIHMPVNVWNRLFGCLRGSNPTHFDLILGQVSTLDGLCELQNSRELVCLLDPLNSLVIPKETRVTTYSYMLRAVLQRILLTEQINPDEAYQNFVQLLVNVTTCPQGKYNGIAHSFRLMNGSRNLDEGQLGPSVFKQSILDYFQEELRRYRETVLSRVLLSVFSGQLNHEVSHDYAYARLAMGRDIGLLFADETPFIDLHGHLTSQMLRACPKQRLVDLFYQYYTVDEVINRTHVMLNNGSIRVEDLTGGHGENLTVKILSQLFDDMQDTIYIGDDFKPNPDFVVLDEHGKPCGLTPYAAKVLLLKLGILVPVAK